MARYSRFLGTDAASPGSVWVDDSAVVAHLVIAAAALAGVAAQPAQFLLAAGTGEVAVLLTAALGPLPPDVKQVGLQLPKTERGGLRTDPGRTLRATRCLF